MKKFTIYGEIFSLVDFFLLLFDVFYSKSDTTRIDIFFFLFKVFQFFKSRLIFMCKNHSWNTLKSSNIFHIYHSTHIFTINIYPPDLLVLDLSCFFYSKINLVLLLSLILYLHVKVHSKVFKEIHFFNFS